VARCIEKDEPYNKTGFHALPEVIGTTSCGRGVCSSCIPACRLAVDAILLNGYTIAKSQNLTSSLKDKK
jgi:hypothetical protein